MPSIIVILSEFCVEIGITEYWVDNLTLLLLILLYKIDGFVVIWGGLTFSLKLECIFWNYYFLHSFDSEDSYLQSLNYSEDI